jgi:hypothetical protein
MLKKKEPFIRFSFWQGVTLIGSSHKKNLKIKKIETLDMTKMES